MADGVVVDPTASVLIVAVWVDPAATDAGAVYANNRAATAVALARGAADVPNLDAVVAVRDAIRNPFWEGD